MKQIFFVLLFFIFSPAFAEINLVGSYTGCGVSSATGPQQIYFHFVQIPTGFGPNELQETASFIWSKGNVETFFPKIKFNEDRSAMLMNLELTPLHAFGTIVKAVKVKITETAAGVTLSGEYISNSAVQGGAFTHGTWTATRVDVTPGQALPTLRCN